MKKEKLIVNIAGIIKEDPTGFILLSDRERKRIAGMIVEEILLLGMVLKAKAQDISAGEVITFESELPELAVIRLNRGHWNEILPVLQLHGFVRTKKIE